MTAKKTESTRELLLDSAGELFAEKGFEGVSTRMIADKAGVKLSAIHYHFGSKENLYNEACMAGHNRGRITTFNMVVDENPSLMETPEGQAELVRNAVYRNFYDHFRANRPEWETKIILRELVDPTTALEMLAEKIFRPDATASMKFYKTVKPDATDCEAAIWSDMLYSPVILYKIARNTMEMAREEVPLDDEFFQTAAKKIARLMILEAGLPLPTDLQQ